MPKPLPPQLSLKLRTLLQQESKTAPELCQLLGISQATLSRVLTAMSVSILRTGKGRATRYYLLRPLDGIHPKLSVFHINGAGKINIAGYLYPKYPRGFLWETDKKRGEHHAYDGLPLILQDAWPSGFLGRLIPQQNPNLNLPADILKWNDDDVLTYFTNSGWSLPGQYLVGEAAYQLFLKNLSSPRETWIKRSDRKTKYPLLATAAVATGDPGSSAAGEQPKFLARITGNLSDNLSAVLVKFSPPLREGAVARRVADLLICEQIALGLLSKNKILASSAEYLSSEDRIFLEVTRFDRVNQFGRKGVLSLHALSLTHGAGLESWNKTAELLCQSKIITTQAKEQIKWLQFFGELIANSDMHHGNLSFFAEGSDVLELAPVYDMLPMLYAPRSNNLPNPTFSPKLPSAEDAQIWKDARRVAMTFWGQVSKNKDVSLPFQKVAQKNLKSLVELEKVIPHLPG